MKKGNFYKNLKSFTNFNELVDDRYYVEVPAQWFVVISDVENSTTAIKRGLYKKVNLVGASTIAAIVNSTGTRDTPFVFGGDGTVALVSSDDLENVKLSLLESQRIAKREHKLNLRIGFVPVAALIAEGCVVKVAKYEMSPNNTIAFFRGTGIGLAEKWVKGGKYNLVDDSKGQGTLLDPHFGLSCRWAPLNSVRGEIVSIIIRPKDFNGDDQFFEKLVTEIDSIVNFSDPLTQPVKFQELKAEKIFLATYLEVGLAKGSKILNWLKTFLTIFVATLLDRDLLKIKAFDMKAYKESLIFHSDYRKYDENLRMVLDCTPSMKSKLEILLNDHFKKGQIYFGIHSSPSALMTCLVPSMAPENHIHFIDGGNGGYALAAENLKAQIKSLT